MNTFGIKIAFVFIICLLLMIFIKTLNIVPELQVFGSMLSLFLLGVIIIALIYKE